MKEVKGVKGMKSIVKSLKSHQKSQLLGIWCNKKSVHKVLLPSIFKTSIQTFFLMLFKLKHWVTTQIMTQWRRKKLYLEQPLRVVLHGHLQLFQPLRRLVLVLRSILLKRVVVAAAALTLAVLLLGQQKGVAARPVLDLILSFSHSTVFCPETEAEN